MGKACLKTLRKVVPNATFLTFFNTHHLILKMPILEGKEGLTPQLLFKHEFRGAKMGAIDGFEKRLPKARVFFAGNNFLVFPEPIDARNSYEAWGKVWKLSEQVGRAIVKLFPSLRLAWKAEVCRAHISARGGLSNWVPEGFRYSGYEKGKPCWLVVDYSKGEAEIEAQGRYAFEGMLNLMSLMDRAAQGEFKKEENKSLPDGQQRLEVS
jgi:hypothetical protein